jgi:hypothetical protein
VKATRHEWLGWVSADGFGQVSQYQVPVGHIVTNAPRDALGGRYGSVIRTEQPKNSRREEQPKGAGL